MIETKLHLTLDARGETSPLELSIRRLIVAGWVGKDKAALQAHIDELAEMGVPAPSRTPTYMNLSPAILTTGTAMDVTGPESSGEVECVLFKSGPKIYMGVGSDHTDRYFEKYDIPASKGICAKPVSGTVWELDEVRPHLDRIVLRSFMTVKGERRLYQEGTLAGNLDILEIMAGIPGETDLCADDFCLFCGTFPAIGGLAVGERFEFEMEDPVLGRTLRHGYDLGVLPQYL